MVSVGNNTSATLILNTGAPQGCVLSPLLYSLFTHDCVATHDANTIIKFADDITVLGLITNNDKTPYKEEVKDFSKTKELIIDYRKRRAEQTIMVQTHQDSCEEATTTPFTQQIIEKIWHGSPDPQKPLQLTVSRYRG